jgi:25S rRNA (uracil2843-N3)-methyltransferase
MASLQNSNFTPEHRIGKLQPRFTMGKNGRFGKEYGTVVEKEKKSRPGWKGTSYVKKAEPANAKRTTADEQNNSSTVSEAAAPFELQQLLLNIFRDTFPVVLGSETLQALLQQVKKALYERDFAQAFGKEEFLEAYAIRWSPSRTLCYQSILLDISKYTTKMFSSYKTTRPKLDQQPAADDAVIMRIICFGGGAAEVVAFGGFLRCLESAFSRNGDGDELRAFEGMDIISFSGESSPTVLNQQSSTDICLSTLGRSPRFDMCLVDTAQWQSVVYKLHENITSPPPLSKYASSMAKNANEALAAAANFGVTFRQDNILEMTGSQLVDILGGQPGQPMLLTLLFTLNELYTSSIGKTTAFLLNLTATVKSGSLLLVVDSPGSYSETTVGTAAKKYPMHVWATRFLTLFVLVF